MDNQTSTGSKGEDGVSDSVSFYAMRRHQNLKSSDYGYVIDKVSDGSGKSLQHTVVGTMMRVDLPEPLRPRSKFVLGIDWSFSIVHRDAMFTRGGYEVFKHKDRGDTYIYFLAQWFPRMVAYTDYVSWQHKQFLGRGEFTLEFGNYDVELTVPADHIVSATGELANARSVLTAAQRARLDEARDADKRVFVVTPDEALANEQKITDGTKTWRFVAENVRDFAWASSRKFVWDALGHRQPEGKYKTVMAMSFYPHEAEPIWSQYSTEAVVHTMDVYSRFSFPYPYPTSQSVNTWEAGGMEYPMITFNGYRPKPIKESEKKGLVEDAPNATYDRGTKHALIGVIIHEIGHNYFPMIVNSDEREWTWMDEGINSFLEHLAELEWEENFHDFRDRQSILDSIGPYMSSGNQVPIMTQSDSVLQLGPNAYTKPTAALVVLRETVMGRELFDFAFKEYARRWRFKRPTPEDFFRTMEDASAVDLDWFWRGWFYTTDHVDVDLRSVREYQVSTKDPDIESVEARRLANELEREPIEQIRNRDQGIVPRKQRVPGLEDFYNENDKYTVSPKDRNDYKSYIDALEPWEAEVLAQAVKDGEFIYFVDFVNVGGLVSALPLLLEFHDGSTREEMIPAELWRRQSEQVTKLFIFDKRLKSIELDPLHQTADVDRSNNYYPRRILPSRLELYKQQDTRRDLMKDMLVKLKAKDEEADESPGLPLGEVQ
jgi:aminopeptidase N